MTTAAAGGVHPPHPPPRTRTTPSSETGPGVGARRVSVTVVVLACVLSWTSSAWDGGDHRWVWWVAAAGLVAGIPHGALDHVQGARLLVTHLRARTGRRPVGALTALVVSAGAYATVTGLAYLLFLAEPAPALLLFLALSVAHFGTGETTTRGQHRWARPIGAAVVGSLVLLVPLARDPALTGTVVSTLAPHVGVPAGWAAPVLLVVPLAAAAMAVALLVGGRRPDAVEISLLLVLVCTTPALVALAVYFGGWHAVRHTARLLDEDPGLRRVAASRGAPAALGRFGALAAVPTLVVVVGLAALWWRAGTPVAALAATLPVLAAVTVPHSVVIGWSAARRPHPPLAPAGPTTATGSGRWP